MLNSRSNFFAFCASTTAWAHEWYHFPNALHPVHSSYWAPVWIGLPREINSSPMLKNFSKEKLLLLLLLLPFDCSNHCNTCVQLPKLVADNWSVDVVLFKELSTSTVRLQGAISAECDKNSAPLKYSSKGYNHLTLYPAVDKDLRVETSCFIFSIIATCVARKWFLLL